LILRNGSFPGFKVGLSYPTLGGNDLLQVISRKGRDDSVDLAKAVVELTKRYEEVLIICKKLPNSTVILTVYDLLAAQEFCQQALTL
jgi:hypothetical protein